jgi:hypothetical protein
MSYTEPKAERERRREIALHVLEVGRNAVRKKLQADGHTDTAVTVEQVVAGLRELINQRGK